MPPLDPPPSRASNPFATCWTDHSELAYEPPVGLCVDRLVNRIERVRGVGAIVGAHGAGKSALLAEVARRLGPGSTLDLIEGFERLSCEARRRRLGRRRPPVRRAIVTLHSRVSAWRCGARVLAVLRPDERLVERLFQRLTRRADSPVTLADARASFHRHDRNLRDVWFDLYELHEWRTRRSRTAPVTVAYSR